VNRLDLFELRRRASHQFDNCGRDEVHFAHVAVRMLAVKNSQKRFPDSSLRRVTFGRLQYVLPTTASWRLEAYASSAAEKRGNAVRAVLNPGERCSPYAVRGMSAASYRVPTFDFAEREILSRETTAQDAEGE
jgi:hypothetical protein